MAISSMTGFASGAFRTQSASVAIDIRSVNQRHLDITLRLPEELRALEYSLREVIARHAHRGKIECRIHLERLAQDTELTVDEARLTSLLMTAERLRVRAPELAPLSVAEALSWPGVMIDITTNDDSLNQSLMLSFEKVAQEFAATRAREGEKLAAVLAANCQTIRELIAEVKPKIGEIQQHYLSKLGARLFEAGVQPSDERLKMEFSLFASKIDVAEELVRLESHVAEVERALAVGGAVGKRLDFLMQELNREANTLGSKSVDIGLTQISVDLKVAIEQMREQIQNLE